MTDLTKLTIAAARTKLRAKEITASELTEAYLAAIDDANPVLNAYIAVTHDKARDMAKRSDVRITKGEAGALEGRQASFAGPVFAGQQHAGGTIGQRR